VRDSIEPENPPRHAVANLRTHGAAVSCFGTKTSAILEVDDALTVEFVHKPEERHEPR